MSLIAHLKTIPDFRTQPRYPLWVVLLLVIMGILSGTQAYRALEDFVAPQLRASRRSLQWLGTRSFPDAASRCSARRWQRH